MKETKVIKQHTFGHLYSTHATFSSLKKFSCARHSSSKLDSALTCRNFLLAFPDTFRCVSCQFSETTQANNSSEFPLFLHFISARNARTAVIVVLYIHHMFFVCVNGLFSRRSRRFTQTNHKTTLNKLSFSAK